MLELDDDLSYLYNRVPAYVPNRPIGKNSLKQSQGFVCEICNRFLRTKTDAENHLKCPKHYHEFMTAVKQRFRSNVDKFAEEEKLALLNNERVDVTCFAGCHNAEYCEHCSSMI